MKPRELCEKAWQEIAGNFPDFKVLGKGQVLKKVAGNKDITFEIFFQANRYNFEGSVEFIPHVRIYSKTIKKAIINDGLIYGGDLGTLTKRKPCEWWQLAGESYRNTVTEVSRLIEVHIIPLFLDFEDTEANIDKILAGKLKSHSLLYYIYFFGGKSKAEQYFNKIISGDKLKKKYVAFYNSLKELPKEAVNLRLNEFYGAEIIKFAYLNDLELI